MTRRSTLVLILALLAATAAAFAVTERLKLQPAPIRATHVTKIFSPVCGCPTRLAHISFRLRRRERVTVEVLNPRGGVARTLAVNERLHAGLVSFLWNGRTAAGVRAPDGAYRVRVVLRRDHRTINMPNRIVLDTRAPRVIAASIAPHVLSPDGDHRSDVARVTYRTDKPARVLVLVDGVLRIRSRLRGSSGAVAWYARSHGKGLPAGRYRVTFVAHDLAGNASPQRLLAVVTIRYVTLPRNVAARAGHRFRVAVSTDAKRVVWRLDGRTGLAAPKPLVLAAPARPGRYQIVVAEHGHAARTTLVVR